MFIGLFIMLSKKILTIIRSCQTKNDYLLMRNLVRKYGINNFKKEMQELGWFKDNIITSELHPFNPFSRIITGKTENPCKDIIDNKNFMILKNRDESDDNWQSNDPQWLGKASMSKNHKFLCLKSLEWSTFNILTFGMNPDVNLSSCIDILDEMELTALNYTKKYNWSNNIGLYFHCLPFNSVQLLHLHIIDLDIVGPSFYVLNSKNLPLNEARNALYEELIEDF